MARSDEVEGKVLKEKLDGGDLPHRSVYPSLTLSSIGWLLRFSFLASLDHPLLLFQPWHLETWHPHAVKICD